jgi:hypothetical protein
VYAIALGEHKHEAIATIILCDKNWNAALK